MTPPAPFGCLDGASPGWFQQSAKKRVLCLVCVVQFKASSMVRAVMFVSFALSPLGAPQDARLWYGIGLLYDCYGSYGHAIEAFDACLKMDPNFELDHEASAAFG